MRARLTCVHASNTTAQDSAVGDLMEPRDCDKGWSYKLQYITQKQPF